jgi:hypothetical protein
MAKKKKKKEPLPFPRVMEGSEDCLGCGYPVEGIPSPGSCPECGLPFEHGLSGLQIAGVAKTSAGPAWRRAVWLVIAIVAFLYGNLVTLLFINSPIIALVILAALIAGVVGMALTSPSKKGVGSEYFTFVQGGFWRWPVGADQRVSEFRSFDGVNPGVTLKPVSRVWASMSVVQFNEHGKREELLSGGFRCQQIDLQLVGDALESLVRGESIAENHELIERLNNLHNPEFTSV